LGQPNEEDVKKWLFAQLVNFAQWIRYWSGYYLGVVRAYLLSKVPQIDPDQKQRMYDRSLLLKEFTVDVLYQWVQSCFRCCRRAAGFVAKICRGLADMCRELMGMCRRRKKDPADARYAAPPGTAGDGPPPESGPSGAGSRRVAPGPERPDPPAG